MSDAPTSRPVVFLSDFGYRNEWVGICHAVIDRIAPGHTVVDLSHGIPPLEVRAGALLLVDSLPYLRHDAVCLAVVDPSVGRDRDIAVRAADGRLFVGPDNGLLSPAWRASGGAAAVVAITSPNVLLEPVAPTFHARDVLAPAAGHLAAGAALEDLGPPIDPSTLIELQFREPRVEGGKIACEVLDLNRFGNIQLNVRSSHLMSAGLDRAERVRTATLTGSAVAKAVATYADLAADEWGILVDDRGWMAVVRGNPGNAAAGLGVAAGDIVWLSRDQD